MATTATQRYPEKGDLDDVEAESARQRDSYYYSDAASEYSDNSPIEEVAANVPNWDDPTLPVMTFRFWTLGISFSVILSYVNQFFYFRSQPVTVGVLVAQLLAYPIGKFMERVLPERTFFFLGHHWTLNPGPFNMKEHVLITCMANCAYLTAYAIDIIIIQEVFYHQRFGFCYGLLLVLTTQCIGYGLAGFLRRYLVWPYQMVWPSNLVSCALFQTLHSEDVSGPRGPTRFKFFCIACAGMFVYYWLPGYVFPVLTAIGWVCWVNPKSVMVAQLGSAASGLGIGSFSLDWGQISSWLGSPLVTPWWAEANILVGFVLVAWVMVPIAYYTNLWDAQRFPILNPHLYTVDGAAYDVSKTYGVGFAGLTSIISHTILYHGKTIVRQFQQSRFDEEDVHARLMKVYPEVPQSWYLIILATSLALAIFTVHYWPVHLPWWGVVLAISLSALFSLPIGIITAITNQTPGLNIITEFIIGFILPGRPIANVVFKTFGYISMTQALSFVTDLKLGHYMKVPPRAMFVAQVTGTILAGIVNMITASWIMDNVTDVCTDGAKPWNCPSSQTFFSASVIWGVIGPRRMFGSESIYNPVLYGFLIGVLLPIPVWLAAKRWPDSWIKYVHVPVMLNATGIMPPAPTVAFTSWILVGFIFNFLVHRIHHQWWARFNYVLSAAFDSGVALSGVVIYFCLQYSAAQNGINLNWWGKSNQDWYNDECPLGAANYSGVNVYAP